MNTIDTTTLSDILINMLERTAMVLAEPAEDDAEYPSPTHYARIAYTGPSQGTIVLGASEGFLCELAAGLLGVETDEVSVDTQGCDALKEMANIVGGSVILALSGEICHYSLGLPEVIDAAQYAGKSNSDPSVKSATCTVVGENGPLHVIWQDAPLAAAA